MDQTPLHAFIAELATSDRFQAFTKSLPGRARVSEPALPLVLAALHTELGRGLLVLLPEDADARDAAEAASWFLGPDLVALLPGRGVSYASGLAPPPHLVGERARALDVLARGGLVCASATALAEGMPPLGDRPAPVALVVGEELGLEKVSEELACAGYERVERVDQRGQFAVRGGIVDVFPATGREPLRVEFFGDEIEQVRAFSPFTQRALHPVKSASVYPAAERRSDAVDVDSAAHEWESTEDEGGGPLAPEDLVPPVDRPPDFVWQPDEVRAVWEEEALTPVALDGATELDPFPRGQAFQFEAQRPAIAARGLSEAENELAGFVRSDNRVVVTFPIAARHSDRVACSGRSRARSTRTPRRFPGKRRCASPSHRPGGALSGEIFGSSSFPTRKSSASDLRARTRGSVARSRRSPIFASAITSCTRITESASSSGSRRRRSPVSRATTSSSRSAATTGSTCRTSSSASSRGTSVPMRRLQRCRSSAARHGRT